MIWGGKRRRKRFDWDLFTQCDHGLSCDLSDCLLVFFFLSFFFFFWAIATLKTAFGFFLKSILMIGGSLFLYIEKKTRILYI
jgi:hypothetical protein